MGSSERIFFFLKLPVFIFLLKHKEYDKKNRYPGVDIKLYIAALHIKKNRDLERCTHII